MNAALHLACDFINCKSCPISDCNRDRKQCKKVLPKYFEILAGEYPNNQYDILKHIHWGLEPGGFLVRNEITEQAIDDIRDRIYDALYEKGI